MQFLSFSTKMGILYYLVLLGSFYFCSGQYIGGGAYRPCRLRDRRCIGRVFSQQLRCALRTRIPDSQTISYMPLYYPNANMTVEYINATVSGLRDFRVDEMTINPDTNTLVMEITFRYIDLQSPNTIGYFHRKGREPIITSGYTYTVYRNYSLTLVVLNVDGRNAPDVTDYHVFTYVNDVHPPFGYDASFVPTDPQAYRQFMIYDYDDLPRTLMEEGLTQGPLLLRYILPCDLPLSVLV